ncbi:GABA/polyamine transporter [Spathaspora passalidarum NRRL Y-27907]|uniref:GABA/polyamine transporter n=1 Tax=Spathaspora passalidarum (strain NRRL Y-27907 / 11-Y1) TaxID=619300 RepID=G3AFT5_SPAPN|nr:GABA/polyamine transporter [Spathaspora passalidarum NRRL Y-27907]EGW35074.1 GABA/polyamine transporter [Spathaspora passalidarum NRRL Y-27907]
MKPSASNTDKIHSNPISPVISQVHVDDLGISSILSNKHVTLNIDHEVDKDEALILAMGYKQEFKREFSLWSVFAVSFSVLGLLPSIAACFDYQQLVIGMSPIPWIIAVIFVTSVALSLAEVASAFPVASGTPYAVSRLAPPKYQSFLTWITCWSNWMCQITASPSVNYSGACMMLALRSYNDPSYTPTNGEIYALTLGIQIVHGIISSLPTGWLAKFNSAGTTCNILFLFIVFVMILAGNNRQELNPDIEGLTKFNVNAISWSLYNQTEWPTGIAMLMSFLGVIWAMSGYDSPFHLSEECSNAAVAAPKAIVLTSTVGGLIGFLFMIAIAYTVVDIDLIAQDPQGLGQPFVTYLAQIMNGKLVIAATALTIISSFFMGCSCMLAASRVTFAYSRDGMFPGSRWWKQVLPLTQTPVNAVWINLFLGQLFLLLMFAGDVAIGAIFSVGGIAGFVSFTMPTLLKITYARDKFVPGPWSLGKWSSPIGFVSVAFVAVMIPILCFPYVRGADLNPEEMNWTALVFFGPLLLATIWFVVDAHKWYVGPKSNLDEYIEYSDQDELEGIDGKVEHVTSNEKS